jgi:arylsulfatase A-like enzyme
LLTRLRAADEARRYLTFEAIVRACVGNLEVPPDVLARMRRLYAGSLRYVDAWLGRVLEALTSAAVLDDTLVIVCSDHGENFGEGGLMAHMLSVDDRLLHVPFIAAGPGENEFEGMLSLAELPARTAAAAGLKEHPWHSGLAAGLPVAQWDPLAPASHPRVAEVTSKWRLSDDSVRRLTRPLTCAVSGHFKLVLGADDSDEELYDLKLDPLELAPLRGEEALARAGDALQDLRAAARHASVQQTAANGITPAAVPEDEVAEIERRMRLMGYM